MRRLKAPARLRSGRMILALVAGVVAYALVVAVALGAPTISGSDSDVWNASRVPVTYTITPSSAGARITWVILQGTRQVASGKGSPAKAPALADGSYVLVATEHDSNGTSSSARRKFVVDTTPPIVVLSSPLGGATFTVGQVVASAYGCVGAVSCVGPVPSGTPIDTAAAGPHAFPVTATNQAGNIASVVHGYTVVAPPPPPPPPTPPPPTPPSAPPAVTTRLILPTTFHADRLRPRRGALLRTTRPELRWRARHGARLYNVQIFQLDGQRFIKVLSAFPRVNRLRVPAGRLRRGIPLVWRVWPMVGRRFTRTPEGASFFEVAPLGTVAR